jgi:V/A-type H+-transporting ATPase subunit B
MTPPRARSPLDAPVETTVVDRVDGPLLFVTGTEGVAWDDHVEIRSGAGPSRHGVVIDIDHDLAVIQVFEGTDGLGTLGTTVAFSGSALQIPVTDAWLGRISNGRGAPVDGGPPVLAALRRPVAGQPINPARRDVPEDPVITGISVIDGLTTLVRGQKLPIFSLGGLPHLELAIQIAAQATVADAAFRVVFAGMGLTNADADLVRHGLQRRLDAGDATLFLNTADDPVIERILTPRLALTVAEHLAFDLGNHVLVILTDMTSYCDAVRQLSSARGEVPSRRGYPGYLFSDLAAIYERCGRLEARPGSITELPVLTMPAGDITHPVPDLTGYITEGQLVLSKDLHSRNIYPPIDALSSLSRLMRLGAGPGRTRDDHLAIAAQLLALLAQARRADELASLIGIDALSVTEQRYLALGHEFEAAFVDQGRTETRRLETTLDKAWATAATVPPRELTMVTPAQIAEHLPGPANPHPGPPETEDPPR